MTLTVITDGRLTALCKTQKLSATLLCVKARLVRFPRAVHNLALESFSPERQQIPVTPSMRALYVSHTGMSEPLGRSQVVPYLVGLAQAGVAIDVVAFEPPSAAAPEIAAVTQLLGDHGIGYAWTRRSPSHALATKLAESLRAFVGLLTRALAKRPRVIHARSYLPGAVAQLVRRMTPGSRFLFDCRGLLGDEYVDFGHWSRGSFRYRLIKLAERRLFGGADAIVVLTDRLRRWLREEERLVAASVPVEVIPCCVDLARFAVDDAARAQARRELGAGDRLVVAYAGTLGAWYCEAEMARLFAAVRRRRPALFLVLTRADAGKLRRALGEAGISDGDIVVRSAAQTEMPSQLSAADVGISFAEPRFSKIASSPVKVAEYLAVGAPVVLNRGVGDQDPMLAQHPESLLDAGQMTAADLEAAAARIAALPLDDAAARARHHALAGANFALDGIGIARYRRLYERMAH
jgi:glycosyltransferase involved in cell wall biosynthesis